MLDGAQRAKWQSLIETASVAIVAGAVVWMVLTRSTPTTDGPKVGPEPPIPEPAIPMEPITLAGAQVMGDQSAKVGLVVYSDFQCPFCGKFARETLPTLDEQYVRTGKIRIAFRQFPLPKHQFAMQAAEAADCAGRQGKFWHYHDRLFANPQSLDPNSLHAHAEALQLNTRQFTACMNGQASANVQADKASGTELQVTGTPAFLAGTILSDGRMKVVERFNGARPIPQFQRVLDRLLSNVAAGQSPGQD